MHYNGDNAIIVFKPLQNADLTLLYQWFQTPHVLRWYARGEHHSLDDIKKKYSKRIDAENIPNFIIFVDEHPIGYIQLYHVSKSLPDGVDDYQHALFQEYKFEELAGIDLFIGDENYLHKGYGSAALAAFIQQFVKGKFKAVVVDPVDDNDKAISFYERNGFVRKYKNNNHILLLKILDSYD